MVRKFFLNALLALAMIAAAVMLVPALLGYHRYVILTGSMTGTYDPGTIVFDKPVPVSTLKVGDVITYSPPPGASLTQKRVTHRIWRITRTASGEEVFHTKGDANPAPDPWKFTLPQPTQDKVDFAIPYVGYVFEVLSIRNFRFVLIGLPALLAALWIIRGMWREAGQEMRDQQVRPWGEDIAKRIPALAPLQAASAAAANGPRAVFLKRRWPKPVRKPAAAVGEHPRPGRLVRARLRSPEDRARRV